ncbi:phosphatidate cytidylyltransferase [Virgibacillus sp. NKC19-16]|uniref:phosphatidate cytidylyltransferase n=1 Tax=Virgibacillus salidurans TaxID=2831673 RepID=UPI001F3B942B|nr:phosphatidate cytidylyltransferase [Virgibacillus sp. NKC19-16]UJL47962.1 phosphatidate cytidylyltransferase [Virgibacillus sp. NKC19-16]
MKQRTLTAILSMIVFLPFVIYGDWPFTLFVYVIATIGLIELMKMHKIVIYSVPSILAIGFLWVILFPMHDSSGYIGITDLTQTEVVMIFVLLLLSYTVLVKNKFTFDDTGFILLAIIYVGMGFFYLIETRNAGLNYILYALFIVWATDTGAYLFGRYFGKRKLWPKISPKKTIEGALGGVFLACVVAVVFQLIYPFAFSMLIVVGATIVASVFGQIGDLVESAFKRHYNVKDSGNILPGHGGILDRFDSLLFVLPLLHFIGFI